MTEENPASVEEPTRPDLGAGTSAQDTVVLNALSEKYALQAVNAAKGEGYGMHVSGRDFYALVGLVLAAERRAEEAEALARRLAKALGEAFPLLPEPTPCPGRGTDGHGMRHCAECCFGSGYLLTSDEDGEEAAVWDYVKELIAEPAVRAYLTNQEPA